MRLTDGVGDTRLGCSDAYLDTTIRALLLRLVSAIAPCAAMLFAFAGVTAGGAAAAGAAVSDETPAIGASFIAFWTTARDRPFEEQEAAWDRLIEGPRHDIYASVVWEIRDHVDWKEQKDKLLRHASSSILA